MRRVRAAPFRHQSLQILQEPTQVQMHALHYQALHDFAVGSAPRAWRVRQSTDAEVPLLRLPDAAEVQAGGPHRESTRQAAAAG